MIKQLSATRRRVLGVPCKQSTLTSIFASPSSRKIAQLSTLNLKIKKNNALLGQIKYLQRKVKIRAFLMAKCS